MGSHVVVTGAAGGIGSSLIEDLTERGYSISALDRSREALESLNQRFPSISTFEVDASESGRVQEVVDAAVSAQGQPFGLVNLAGDNRLQPLEDVSDEDWHYVLNANLSSTFFLCRAVIPLMRKSGGRVVNTSSIMGVRGSTNTAAYSAAKAGVIGLTRALATEFAADLISVNAIAPVVTLTPRVAGYPSAHLDAQLARIPMGRVGTVKDVTRTIAFLLSEDGAFYTGQTFSANGGDTMP